MNIPFNPQDWKIVFESHAHVSCSDRALVLHALNIPNEIVSDGNRYALVVPNNFHESAKNELRQYDTENSNPIPRRITLTPNSKNGMPGVMAFIFILCLVTWLAGESTFNRDWFIVGRVDGALIRHGEWWRSITALTLHADIRHLLGNLCFGAIFGLIAGNLVGPGVAWLSIIVASGTANIMNTTLLVSSYRSIGASTAVFAALGLVAGFSWRAKLMAQDRWPYRFGPIIGGIALLAYTGIGDANTDIGAHLAGFVYGFIFGVILTILSSYLPRRGVQLTCGIAAATLIGLAWIIALKPWAD